MANILTPQQKHLISENKRIEKEEFRVRGHVSGHALRLINDNLLRIDRIHLSQTYIMHQIEAQGNA